MQVFKAAIPTLTLAAMVFAPQSGSAQPLGAPAQGSRPGQTFQAGAPVNQVTPASATQSAPASGQTNQSAMQGPAAKVAGSQVQSSNARTLAAGTPVIMEFSDLQCPDSAMYNTGLKTTITQKHGNAVYQWHDFPLPVHAQAPEAAVAARCAGAAADRMRMQIMANQGQMSEAVYAQYARQLGVDPAEFTACMRSGATMREVMSDKELGQSMGVRGTPTLVLGTADGNGKVTPVKVVKAYDPPEQVTAEIDKFMASAGRPSTGR